MGAKLVEVVRKRGERRKDKSQTDRQRETDRQTEDGNEC